MSTKFNEAGFEIIEDENLLEYVGKALFTGILFGGSDAEWETELNDEQKGMPRRWRDWYRSGALDAIRAYREYERNNG